MPFILGVIPARGGSKGIPRKNLHLLCNVPLIKYTFDAAKASTMLSDVIVSTDSREILNYAEHNGIKAPFLRPIELSADDALAVPTIQHAVLSYESIYKVNVDIVVMLQPTAPLRRDFDIDHAINLLLNSSADGLISVTDVNNCHPYKMKVINDGKLQDYLETGLENPPRQSLPPIYIVNGALYICRRDVLIKKNSFKGNFCLPFVMPSERSANIDSLADFALAEFFLNSATTN